MARSRKDWLPLEYTEKSENIALSGAFQAIKALLLSGFGELFPLVAAGIMTALILAIHLPRRAAR